MLLPLVRLLPALAPMAMFAPEVRLLPLAFRSAEHVLLVIPASRSGIERGGPLAAQARELCCAEAGVTVIARLDPGERKALVSELAPIAEAIGATVVLCPQLEDLYERPVQYALERAGVTLQALRGVLAR